MKTLATALVSASLCAAAGCASTMANGASVPDEPKSGLSIDLASNEAASPTFPARITAAQTPRAANRLASQVIADLGGEAKAGLRLCVDGTGAVTSARVDRSSGLEQLDEIFTAEAKTWRYEPLAVPSATACQNVEITYRVR